VLQHERCDARRAINVPSVGLARIEVGDHRFASPRRRIEIGVEHTDAAGKLEFAGIALANVERRLAQMGFEIAHTMTHDALEPEPAVGGRRDLLWRRSFGRSNTASQQNEAGKRDPMPVDRERHRRSLEAVADIRQALAPRPRG
jgi:hypothetical protein